MIYDKIESAFKSTVYSRADDTGTIFYFSSEDFPGLQKKPYPFRSSDGHSLSGYFYSYPCFKSGRIVIFEHGMGSGHRGYMKEIELLARHGYLVFAYDHTGCMESGGETTGGFVQSLKDLNDAINTLHSDEEYRALDISVVGHSWGGFSTLNITAFHPEISHIVAMSAPISVPVLLEQYFHGALHGVYRRLYEAEKKANPALIDCNAISALSSSSVHALIIHSSDDKTVSCKKHFDVLQKALAGRENINFLKVNGKNHNPNYTCEAVKYKDNFFAEYKKLMKKAPPKTDAEKKAFIARYDWNAMTEQDASVWEEIFAALE